MSFIEAEHLKYRYPHTERLALNDISFQVERGEFIGIAGENKAGKSTLCQAFVGLVPQMFKGAYGGRLRIGEQETASVPIAQLCRTVGLVFQNPFNQLSGAKDTVFEEVAFGLQNLGVPREEILRRVEKNLALMEIEEYRDRNPFDLSGGQTQRVAIAGILAMEPEVIVLDEPTSQLDPQGSEEVFRVVEKLAHTGITIFMVEHKLEKLAAYCDRILLLHEGGVAAFDTPERVFSRNDLDQLGVQAPVYTRVCRAMGVGTELEKTENGAGAKSSTSGGCVLDTIYPVTEADTVARKEGFPTERLPEGGVFRDDIPEQSPEKQACPEHREEVFTVQDLSFSYRPQSPVLSNLTLRLDTRPTAIVGQNGAGKTTLVKLLKGLLKPDSGSICFQGTDLSGKTVAKLAGSIGYVFQNPDDQIFKNRVLDEVMVGPLNIGMSRTEAEQQAERALELVGLLGVKEENPYDLDLAERKLVAVASVLAMNTKVLILDEPTIAQDAAGRKCIGGLVRKLAAEGRAVIAILHDMDFAAEYFERVIAMAHGRILADGTPETVFYRQEALREARLEQPHVASLGLRLGYQGHYLTVDAMKAIKEGAAR